MAVSRHQVVKERLERVLDELATSEGGIFDAGRGGLPRLKALELFRSQLTSRLIDLEARAMKARNEGFYTIGSSGHEGSACVADALRPTDPCFLHYRSGGFMVQRAAQIPGSTPIFDTLLSLSASAEDPISGGRHKVWGLNEGWVPPQTSTIGSHVPKAVGAAFALGRWKKVFGPEGRPRPVPDDAIVMASFGDASLNHSTTVGAINAALWTRYQSLPMPLLILVEDNGIGISVRTPTDWVANQYAKRSGLSYFQADGLDLENCWLTAQSAVAHCRQHKKPVMLHMRCVRLMGHAGSDVEQTYRRIEEIEEVEALDPLIRGARWLVERGYAEGHELRRMYDELRDRIESASREASRRPKLTSRAQVLAPLAPHDEEAVALEAKRPAEGYARIRAFGGDAQVPDAVERPRHMAMLINWALHDLMAKYPELILFGEDVAKKGGVYHVTTKLAERFGVGRVFNTLLDEQTILGVALGAAQLGYLPCPEIQYLAYLVHASDQLRGEAASLQFFSNGAWKNPMVVRVAGLAYQKGFGGHFHNDNGFAFLREIPGMVLAAPSRGDDAVGMLRTLFAAARTCGRVSVFLEPIALYMTKDLHEANDGQWSFSYPETDQVVPLGEGRIYEAGAPEKLTIVSYGNGMWMSLRVARRLEERGIGVRLVDLRWLLPLNHDLVRAEAARAERLLVVDEARMTGGPGEEILAAIATMPGRRPRCARVAGADCFVPLAAAADLVLVSETEIEAAAAALLEEEA
ncbi:MAG: MFS transporter [Planctomycetes bacterium]|nr:MFS transporter [Planctomycetota bacterium]